MNKQRAKFAACSTDERQTIRTHIKTTTAHILDPIKYCKHLCNIASTHLPKVPSKPKEETISQRSRYIVEKRQKAADEPDPARSEQLTKDLRASRKKDKKDYVLKLLAKDLDIRDKWMGIKNLNLSHTTGKTTKGNLYHITTERRSQPPTWRKNNGAEPAKRMMFSQHVKW